MKEKPFKKNDRNKKKEKKLNSPPAIHHDPSHLGSSNAFSETEDPESPDPDGITDEKLDEWLDQ
jgi:hypothetical protein